MMDSSSTSFPRPGLFGLVPVGYLAYIELFRQ